MRRLVLIPVLLLAAVAFGQELLVNGDFEQDLSVGWTRIDSGTVTHEANRDVGYEPDPDYEAYVYTYDNPGSTILVQTVEVPCALVEFSFRAAFVESAGSSSCSPSTCARPSSTGSGSRSCPSPCSSASRGQRRGTVHCPTGSSSPTAVTSAVTGPQKYRLCRASRRRRRCGRCRRPSRPLKRP